MSLELGLAVVASLLALLAFTGLVLLARDRTGGATTPDIGHLSGQMELLRREVHQGREDALRGLADVAQGLQGRIATAQRELAEVKTLEQARARQLDRATDSLRRLETVVAGSSSRGAAGEGILAGALGQLPPDLLETNAAFGGRAVEYAFRLPGGRLLPIDSKWTSAGSLERLETTEDPEERKRLRDRVARDVRVRVREMTKYLDPERTLSLAVLAVPDAVHAASVEAHAEGWREGVLVVPYSLTLSLVLVVYRLSVRFGAMPEAEELQMRLLRLGESLRRMDEEVEGRLSRGLVQLVNARDQLRGDLAVARGHAQRLSDIPAQSGVDPSTVPFDPFSGRG